MTICAFSLNPGCGAALVDEKFCALDINGSSEKAFAMIPSFHFGTAAG
jgi:hypothetical protein